VGFWVSGFWLGIGVVVSVYGIGARGSAKGKGKSGGEVSASSTLGG